MLILYKIAGNCGVLSVEFSTARKGGCLSI